MRSILAILLLLIALAPLLQSQQSRGTGEAAYQNLVIAVQKLTKKSEIVGSRWYAADLLNNGDRSVSLEAIQMPGGYAGSGQFVACDLEVWDVRNRAWRPLRTEKASEFGHNPEFINIEIKPGQHFEVCSMLLPSQAGAVGQCIRFLIHPRWRPYPSGNLFSGPFTIGEKPKHSDSPCQ
jgi:hypothetical protein